MPDGSGFYYTRYPKPGEVPAGEEPYHRSVYRHRLGDDPAADVKVFGDGLSLASWPNLQLSPDGRWLAIEVSEGWSRSDLYLLDRKQGGPPVAVVKGEGAVFSLAEVLDDRLYVLSNQGAPRYQLFEVDPERPEREDWKLVIPEGRGHAGIGHGGSRPAGRRLPPRRLFPAGRLLPRREARARNRAA